MKLDSIPSAGSIGEITSKRIPGREDVEETPITKPQEPNILLEDIELMMVLLEACAQRGAFKISEFSIVGQLNDRVTAYLNSQRSLNQNN
jgi:hypothetical protein